MNIGEQVSVMYGESFGTCKGMIDLGCMVDLFLGLEDFLY